MKAFTLLEVLVVLGITMTLSIMVMPVAISQIQSKTVLNMAEDLSSSLFLYQQNAYSRKNNKSYGISFSTTRYTIFIGNTLASAENFESVDFPSSVTISQISLANSSNEIVYPAGSFKPSTTGTIRLTDGITIYQININSEGLITYTQL